MKSAEEISATRKKIGLAIVAIALVLFASVLWSWRSLRGDLMPIDVYFPYSIHRVSVGGNVIAAGEKIGNIEAIRLARVRKEDGSEKIYAVVTAITDISRAENKIAISGDKAGFARDMKKQIALGLRARLTRPSMMSNGLALELYYDKKSEAFFANDPNGENTEIPIAKMEEDLSTADDINNRIKRNRLVELPDRILAFQAQMEKISNMLNAIDVEAFNMRAVDGTQEIVELLDPEKFSQDIQTINEKLEKVSEQIARGDEDVSTLIEEILATLKNLSDRLNAISERMHQISQSIMIATPEAQQMLQDWQEKTDAFLRDVREITKP